MVSVPVKSVLVADAVDPECIKIFHENGINVTYSTGLSTGELQALVQSHDALIVRSATRVTEEILRSGERLKVVGRAGAGVDNIDIDTATERNIIVINTPGANSISACEMTCALILNLSRQVTAANISMRKGQWLRNNFVGNEVYGKTLAIIGLGRVGREVARRMHAFGMEIIGYDPIVSMSEAAEFYTTKLESLQSIWPLADYITLHTPVNAHTAGMINEGSLMLCKAGVKIINVARGGLICESALIDGLKTGQVSGAALDVFSMEPPFGETFEELVANPKVVTTPHLGASTQEAQIRVGVDIAKQIVNLTDPFTYAVDLSIVNPMVLA